MVAVHHDKENVYHDHVFCSCFCFFHTAVSVCVFDWRWVCCLQACVCRVHIYFSWDKHTCTSVDLDRPHGKIAKPPASLWVYFRAFRFLYKNKKKKKVTKTWTQIMHIPQSIFLHSPSYQSCVFVLNQGLCCFLWHTFRLLWGYEPPCKLITYSLWTHPKSDILFRNVNCHAHFFLFSCFIYFKRWNRESVCSERMTSVMWGHHREHPPFSSSKSTWLLLTMERKFEELVSELMGS